MDKDLEKEYLEDLDHYDEGMGIHSTSYEKCKERLIRLAKIDNANPSEALEKYLKWLERQEFFIELSDKTYVKCIDIIKPALQKAQEQEKVIEIIKKKCLTNCNIALVKDNVHYENYCKEFEYFLNKYNESPNGFEITKDDLLIQEEFDLLKRWLK